jgi:hypothetical protein
MEELTAEQALRVAARDGDEVTVLHLLEAGTPVDASDMIGYTPLMLAARKGQANMVRLLLMHGADWKAENRPRDTALDFAVQSGNIDTVRVLLEREGKITGYRGRELLSRAYWRPDGDIIQLLRSSGASDEVAVLDEDEVRIIGNQLANDELVLCKVCRKPLTYRWTGNPVAARYFFCPEGCTDMRRRYMT